MKVQYLMENCTLYSHQVGIDQIVNLMKGQFPKAQLEIRKTGESSSVELTLNRGFFQRSASLTVNYRERKNPSYTLEKMECNLTRNLSGMVGFLSSIPLANRSLATQFLYKVKSINSEIAFIAKPRITEEFKYLLQKMSKSLDAIAFVQPSPTFNQSSQQHFLDSSLRLLTDINGYTKVDHLDVRIDPIYFDPPTDELTQEQLARRHQSEKTLLNHGVKVNWHLPCLPSLAECSWRTTEEIVDRTYALLIVAAFGEGVEKVRLEKIIKSKEITKFSPWEKALLSKAEPTDREKVISTWRYESIYVLLWALGKVENLPFPHKICDVPIIVNMLMGKSRSEFEASVQLKDRETLLNARDTIYRMNWACVDARLQASEPSGGINPSIVYERHYTLNWLSCYQGADWDNVQTDT